MTFFTIFPSGVPSAGGCRALSYTDYAVDFLRGTADIVYLDGGGPAVWAAAYAA